MTASVPSPGAEINGDGRSGVPAGMESPISLREAERLAEANLELARVLDSEAINATGSFGIADAAALRGRQDRALLLAKSAIDAGYRRVVEDDDTIREIGCVIQHALAWVSDRDYAKASDSWADVGRAVVRALREDT